ncbi:aldehyde dehydrogenase family protein [Clostridia bacterium OttesenSCG-928-F22]|nr:aldehyde dehydrogenase family protein [Clostridia bacterium OttesenSCG-928-F22]
MDVKAYVAEYIARARVAQQEVEKYDQKQIDALVRAIGKAVYDNAEKLARLAIDETRMGCYEDKVYKNSMKSKAIYNSLKGKKSIGIIDYNAETGITQIAKPVGVVGGIMPTTNPNVTLMSNAMFAVKCANALIVSCHPRALKSSILTTELINEALDKLGAPKNLIQIFDQISLDITNEMAKQVDLVIATGGAAMVKSVYSSGTPAVGVGVGNAQAIVDYGMDHDAVAKMVIRGRTYDSSIICSGEQTVFIPKSEKDDFIKALEANNAYVVKDKAQNDALRSAIFPDGHMNRELVGQSAQTVAKTAGFSIPDDKIVVVAQGESPEDLFGNEKMFPVLNLYTYDKWEEGVEYARTNLSREGMGHSIAIHTNDKKKMEYAGLRINVSRVLVNQICASSAGGTFTNGLAPTNSMGCGTWGNNSISENLTYHHLMNVTRVAELVDRPIPSDEEIWAD